MTKKRFILTYEYFEKYLKEHNLTLDEYIEETKIPKDLLEKWKIDNDVPQYAFIFAKKINIIYELENIKMEEFDKLYNKRYKEQFEEIEGLIQDEINRVRVTFWGTNYTAGEIIEKIQRGVRMIEHFKNNAPEELYQKMLKAKVKNKEN